MSREGNQAARINTHAPFEFSSGQDAGYLASRYGLAPDPWQQTCLDNWFAEYKNMRLIHSRVGLSVPRQNGKNAVLEMVELYKMVIQGRKILHTAHEVKTARKAFTRIAGFFENERAFPELAEMLKSIRRTNGQEAIELTNGASVEFIARSRGSGRGYTVDDLVMDEAQDLTDEQLEALLPTISSAPSRDPQQIYTGTPPGPRSPGTVFERTRGLGVSGRDRRLAWCEFSIPDDLTPEKAATRWRELAYDTNPALGIRLAVGSVQDEQRTMSPDGFARERLGQWQGGANIKAIDLVDWRELFINEEQTPDNGRVMFGVKFSADGAQVALAGAMRPKTGKTHVEAIRWESMREGTGWLKDFLLDRKDKTAAVAIDGKYGTGMLVNELIEAGYPKKAIICPRVDQLIAAHSMLEQAIRDKTISTIEQEETIKQVEGAVKRPIGRDGGFGWAPRSEEGTVICLDALTLAFWASRNTRRRPGRKAVAL